MADLRSVRYNEFHSTLVLQKRFNVDVDMGHERSKWNDKARLQVIKAVMKVEWEILNESPGKIVRANGRGTLKWDRVAKMLPRYMRARTWNHSTGTFNQYKCSRLFYSLLRAYKKVLESNVKSFVHISEREYRLFKKREELLNGRFSVRAGNSLESQSLNSDQEDLSNGMSLGSGKEQGASYLAERTYESGRLECCEKLPQLENNLEAVVRDHSDYDLVMESGSEGQEKYVDEGDKDHTTNESGSLECYEIKHSQLDGILETVARHPINYGMSVESDTSESEGPLIYVKERERDHVGTEKSLERPTSSPTLGSASRSGSECNSLASKSKHAATTRVETQALTRAKGRGSNTATRRQATQSRTSRAERQSTTSMTQPTSGEDLNAILERPLRCLDLEFAHLSSWMKSEAIPVGRELVNELTSSALRSCKRRKLNALPPPGIETGPFDGLMHKSSVGMIDSRIRALFHRLRIRLAEELKKTCEDIVQEVTEGA